ncbi:NAD-binding component of TrK potassium transporter [Ketogulonicigenium robustum]|uniref:NAD-binding component of TrK potassium transporter n=1 Tax=Ketogulonicigenium robustum TaxID=92947 RepID=A0A1W6P0V6_9RHOB|nr:TrkA family potassium uptake protein [Ketogulonicigenium robustum]ARO15043.1 NAD-binding component of TrK potassium transporter [Ketogulonicigenium robustum]
MARTEHAFAVIGLGAFGAAVASELARFGNRVIGVDLDERRVAQMAPVLSSVVILDATDEAALREAGIDRYDVALVAIGSSIEASILATMNLRLLGVETLWVKAASRVHHRILAKLGADRVILPEQEMGRHIAQMLNNPVVQDYVSLGNGFNVVSIELPQALEGSSVRSLGLVGRDEPRLLAIMRGTAQLDMTEHDQKLMRGDKLVLLGRRVALQAFSDRL